MDAFQKILSSITDNFYFAVIAYLGVHGILSHEYVFFLLVFFAQWRFQQKQTNQVTSAISGMTGGGGSGSGGMKAVLPNPTTIRPEASYPIPPPPSAPTYGESSKHPTGPRHPRPIPREEKKVIFVMRRIYKRFFESVAVSFAPFAFGIVGTFAVVACSEAVGGYRDARSAADQACSLVRMLPQIASASALPADSTIIVQGASSSGAPSYAKVVPKSSDPVCVSASVSSKP